MPGKQALEVHSGLPDRAGVAVLLEVLRAAGVSASVGRVCGSRVSAVWLGDGLEVVSVTLEASELDDAGLASRRALEFVRETERLQAG
jgi:hypothetical protein